MERTTKLATPGAIAALGLTLTVAAVIAASPVGAADGAPIGGNLYCNTDLPFHDPETAPPPPDCRFCGAVVDVDIHEAEIHSLGYGCQTYN